MKISERTHPLYDDYIDTWNFYLESYKGGPDYVKKYLETHRLEDAHDYAGRLKRGYYLNYCAPICTIPSDFIFKKEATRPADEILSEFRLNVDRHGNNIHEFMRKICTLSSIYGHIHILVDMPRLNDDLQERANASRLTKKDTANLKPYSVIIHPQFLRDWSINSETRELEWIIIQEKTYEDTDFTQDREEKSYYRVWTRQQWFLYDDNDNEIASGPNPLGIVPLVTNFHKDIDLDFIGEGMLKDTAHTNKAVFNWCSDIDEMIARQTFSQLICPDDGELLTDEVDEYGKSKALRRVGSSTIFTYPADAHHAPKFISPDTTQIDTIWTMVDKHVKEMFRMSGLISAKTSLIQMQQRTGKAQEYEFLDMAVFFASKAKKLEDTENRLNKLYYSWVNKDAVPALVHYPDKFDISTPSEVVELFSKVLLNGISPRLNKEMAKRLAHQVLPHAEDAITAQIEDEIEDNEYLDDPLGFINEPIETNETTDSSKKLKQEKEVVPNATNINKRAKWRSPNVNSKEKDVMS